MKVLIACEFSGRVREAFTKKGCDAWSCDIIPTEVPGNHIQDDVTRHLDDGWDLMIAHPPCTYIAVSGNRHFKNNPQRWEKRLEAMLFVYKLMEAPIPRICLENPKSVISSYIRPADQYIQPYEFGEPHIKQTGLWLKNLPLLKPTKVVEPKYLVYKSKHTKTGTSKYPIQWDGKHRKKDRSRTSRGVSQAMAEQWAFTKYPIQKKLCPL